MALARLHAAPTQASMRSISLRAPVSAIEVSKNHRRVGKSIECREQFFCMAVTTGSLLKSPGDRSKKSGVRRNGQGSFKFEAMKPLEIRQMVNRGAH